MVVDDKVYIKGHTEVVGDELWLVQLVKELLLDNASFCYLRTVSWSSNHLLISTKICAPKSGTEGFLASTFSKLSSEYSIL